MNKLFHDKTLNSEVCSSGTLEQEIGFLCLGVVVGSTPWLLAKHVSRQPKLLTQVSSRCEENHFMASSGSFFSSSRENSFQRLKHLDWSKWGDGTWSSPDFSSLWQRWAEVAPKWLERWSHNLEVPSSNPPATFLSAAIGQRPRNSLSCSCPCSSPFGSFPH